MKVNIIIEYWLDGHRVRREIAVEAGCLTEVLELAESALAISQQDRAKWVPNA